MAQQWLQQAAPGAPPPPPKAPGPPAGPPPPVRPQDFEDLMRTRQGPSAFLRDVMAQKPEIPHELWVQDPRGRGSRFLTPLEVLTRDNMAAAQDINEHMEDLEGAFRRAWSTLDPPANLACWGEALQELEVNPHVAERLGDLCAENDMGRAETTRVLHHFFKVNPYGASKYLNRAIDGCWGYLKDWKLFEAATPDLGRGPDGWGRWRTYTGPQDRPAPVPHRNLPAAEQPPASGASGSSDNAWASYTPSSWSSSRPWGSYGQPNAPWDDRR